MYIKYVYVDIYTQTHTVSIRQCIESPMHVARLRDQDCLGVLIMVYAWDMDLNLRSEFRDHICLEGCNQGTLDPGFAQPSHPACLRCLRLFRPTS